MRISYQLIVLMLLFQSCVLNQKKEVVNVEDLEKPVVKISNPKNVSVYNVNSQVQIIVDVTDNQSVYYPSISILRKSDNKIVSNSYGSSFPEKTHKATFNWTAESPSLAKDSFLIKANARDKSGNIGEDSVTFIVTN